MGKNLFVHVKRVHGMSKQEYVLKFEDVGFKIEKCGWCDKDAVPDVFWDGISFKFIYNKYLCNDSLCKTSRKKHNVKSYYAVERTYKLSPEEAKKRVSLTSPFHKDFHLLNGSSYEKFQDNASFESFQKRYGNDAELKFNEYREKISFRNSLDGYKFKYGDLDGLARWKKCCQSKAITIERYLKSFSPGDAKEKIESWKGKIVNTKSNFIKRYGEVEGAIRFEKYICKQKQSLLQLWINKFGEEEGKKRWNDYIHSISCTLELFQCKYGEKDGLRRYVDWNNKRFDFKSGRFVSKVSLDFFEEVRRVTDFLLEFGDPEPWIYPLSGKPLKVDCLIKDLGLVVEFYGDFYHCNPRIYPDDYVVRVKNGKQITAKEKRGQDAFRQQLTLTAVPFLLVVWEKSFRSDAPGTVKSAVGIMNAIKNKEISNGCFEI
jgi:hypothetical protein